MNNSQFRHLVSPANGSLRPPAEGPGASQTIRPYALGSKQRASIPMTPRAVAGTTATSLFARQLAERGEPPEKKAKANAPKGVKLPSQYRDRAKERAHQEDDEGSESQQRWFMGDGDGETQALPVRKTGLDLELLAKSREGADAVQLIVAALQTRLTPKADEAANSVDPPQDDGAIEEAFDELEERDVVAREQRKTEKKGNLAPPPSTSSSDAIPTKRSRNDILAEFRKNRSALRSAALSEPKLGAKFRAIGAASTQPRIEKDSRGREVLITVDSDGVTKRRVRKRPQEVPSFVAEPEAVILGEDVSAHAIAQSTAVKRAAEELERAEAEADIFAGAGEYEPLGGDSSEEDATPRIGDSKPATVPAKIADPTDREGGRNYFGDAIPPVSSSIAEKLRLDSTPRAVIRKPPQAKKLSSSSAPSAPASDAESPDVTDSESETRPSRTERERLLLQRLQGDGTDRDAQDLDLGFGSSFVEDAEDGEGDGRGEKRVKLSRWEGLVGKEDGDGGAARGGRGGARGARGRGAAKAKEKGKGKNEKGESNGAAEVLRVMAGRKTKK